MALRSVPGRLAAALLLTALATSAFAATPANAPAPAPTAIIAPAPWAGPIFVPVDEEPAVAGMSIPLPIGPLTLEEERMISRSSDGLFFQYLPDGTVMLDLQGRFQEFSVARIGPDGRVSYECLSDPASLWEALFMPLPPLPAPVWEDR